MGKTYKDQQRYDKKVFPRVPRIEKRSEPFEDRRFKKEKHKRHAQWDNEVLDTVDGGWSDD